MFHSYLRQLACHRSQTEDIIKSLFCMQLRMPSDRQLRPAHLQMCKQLQFSGKSQAHPGKPSQAKDILTSKSKVQKLLARV